LVVIYDRKKKHPFLITGHPTTFFHNTHVTVEEKIATFFLSLVFKARERKEPHGHTRRAQQQQQQQQQQQSFCLLRRRSISPLASRHSRGERYEFILFCVLNFTLFLRRTRKRPQRLR
jgi:hypothetical protein